MMNIQRRLLLGSALALGIGAAQPAFAQTITLTSWGGAYGNSQTEAFAKPFRAKTGIRVQTEDYSGGLAQIRSQVQTGNVTWDVVDLEMQDALRACDEGLLERLDAGILAPGIDGSTPEQDFVKGALTPCTVGNVAWANIIAYDTDKFGDTPPRTIADFFDVRKFPGKRGMKKSPKANLEWALVADGVPPADVYKLLGTSAGLQRAFRKLDSIKPHIVWWEAGAQAPQLLADGEVTMVSAYSGRIRDAIVQDRKRFQIIWDAQIPVFELFGVVKGTRNAAAARDFIAFATSPQALADQTKHIAYGPLRQSALPLVSPVIKPFLPTTPENLKNAITIDAEWWADNLDDLNQKFSVWLSS